MARVVSSVALAVALALAPVRAWPATPRAIGDPPDSSADCADRVKRFPRSIDAWLCWSRLYYSTRSLEPSISILERHVATGSGNPYAKLVLGVILADQGGGISERLYREAADGFQAEGDLGAEGRARIFHYVTACDAGRCDEVAEARSRAEELAAQLNAPDLWAYLHYFKALEALHEGDFGSALRLFEHAKQESVYTGSPWLKHRVPAGYAAVLSATGRHRQAFEEYLGEVKSLEGQNFFQALARHELAAESVHLASAGQMEWGETDRLIGEALEAAVRVRVRHYQTAGEFSTRILYGLRLGATPEGIAQIEQARALGIEDDHPELQILSTRLLAVLRIERDPTRPAEPLELAAGSIERAERTARRRDVALGRLALAHVRWRSGDRGGAVKDALGALDALEEHQLRQREETLRALSSSETAFAYPLVSGWLLDPSRGTPDPALAFTVMERLRARVLLDALNKVRNEALPSSLHEERTALLLRISRAQAELRGPLEPLRREALLADLSALETADAELRDRIARAIPGTTTPREPPPALEAVQAALGEHEAMITFQTWAMQGSPELPYRDGSSWALIVTRRAARAVRIPDVLALEREVRMFVALIARRDGSERVGAARLYRELLEGALGALPKSVERLVLIPDGPLHRLPFDALRAAPDAPSVAERYTVSIAPSAALWHRFRRSPVPHPGSALLALADPELGPTPAALELEPLPHARAEVRAAVAALGGEGRVEMGANASERLLKLADLSAYGVVHLAAHAVIDEERPERSAIILAPGAPDEDGLLQTREIVALSLSGSAVVLAACRSSSGMVLGGEGPLSLARAFFQAGAHAVIGSLWEVRDDEAAALVSAFYRALGEGQSVAEAMGQARRERIGAGAPAAAWASFSVMGDGDLTPVPRPAPRWPLLGSLGTMVLSALGAVAGLRAFRKR